VDLAAVLTQALETSRPLIEARRHTLTVALPEGPLPIEADPARLAQAVANLLNNAAKFTPEGGHVWLEASAERDWAVVRVRDTGVGISADALPYVFDLFAQAGHGPDRAGLGIGLTLVRNLVELHGGTVKAASAGPGRGSEFTIRLPHAVS
jgi:signal transduction histidine kinase